MGKIQPCKEAALGSCWDLASTEKRFSRTQPYGRRTDNSIWQLCRIDGIQFLRKRALGKGCRSVPKWEGDVDRRYENQS
jgi:hypothetical protein